MTDRLTDDEIKALRQDLHGYHITVAMRKAMLRLLDEIEERRRAVADERRLAGYAFARFNLANAAEKHLPALLRVARAAQKVIGGDTFTADDLRTHFPDAYELLAALAELRGTT